MKIKELHDFLGVRDIHISRLLEDRPFAEIKRVFAIIDGAEGLGGTLNASQDDKQAAEMEVTEDLLADILSQYDRNFYFSTEPDDKKRLRSYRFHESDVEMTTLRSYKEFGGVAVIEAKEYGSYDLDLRD